MYVKCPPNAPVDNLMTKLPNEFAATKCDSPILINKQMVGLHTNQI